MRTLVIGRSPHADIVLADPSVARRHAEVTLTEDGRYFLTDCASAGGTWRAVALRDGEEIWERTRQSFVLPDQPLRFGEHRCRLQPLLERLESSAGGNGGGGGSGGGGGGGRGEAADERLRGPVERDPHTGEIVRRRT